MLFLEGDEGVDEEGEEGDEGRLRRDFGGDWRWFGSAEW